jgi:hypothetical protein
MKREKLLYIVILVVSLLIIGIVVAGFIAQRAARKREEARQRAAGAGSKKTPLPKTDGDNKMPSDPSLPSGTNDKYVQEMAWKFNDYISKGRVDYACEVSNGIATMGINDLRAFAALYEQWYGRKLATDYCTKLNGSGCITSIFDGVYEKACTRLKSL